MPQEIEIKLRIRDEKALWRALKRLKARPIHRPGERLWQHNVIFDTPQGGLAKHGQLLRIRTESLVNAGKKVAAGKNRVLVTFKRPIENAGRGSGPVARGRHRVREEIELEVFDGPSLTKIFQGLGMAGWFQYERYRTTLKLPSSTPWSKGLLIELDETPIGTFLELEGPGDAIDRAAEELGFRKSEYILKNYLALYVEECRRRGEEPRHMLFEAKSR